MPIFFFRGKTATDMALRLVEIQYFSYLLCQRGIDVAKAVGDIFMYRRLRHPNFFALCRTVVFVSMIYSAISTARSSI